MTKTLSPTTKAILLITCFLSIILLSQLGAAQQFTDFFISVHDSVDGLQCTRVTDYVLLTNTQDHSQEYVLTPEGSAAVWTTLSPTNFTLTPGQTQLVAEQFTLPCNAKNAKQLLFTVTTAAGEESITQDIVPQTPLNIEFSTLAQEKIIPPCGTARYDLILTNPANFEEQYTFDTTYSSASEISLSNRTLTLSGNTTRSLQLFIKPNDCTSSGIFLFTVRARTKNTNLIAEQQFMLTILNTGIAEIAPGIRTIQTTRAESKINISITNKGQESTTYVLEVSGVDWVQTDQTKIIISPNGSATATLHFTPNADTPEGYWPVVLSLRAENTGNVYEKKIFVFLERDSVVVRYLATHWARLLIMLIVFIAVAEGIRRLANYTNSTSYKQWQQQRARRKQQLRKQHEKEQKKREQEKNARKEQKKKEQLERVQQQEKLRQKQKEQAEKKQASVLAQAEQELKKTYTLVPKQESESTSAGKSLVAVLLVLILAMGAGALYKYHTLLAQQRFFVGWGVGIALSILILLYIISSIISSYCHTCSKKYLLKGQNLSILGWRTGILMCAVQADAPVVNPSMKLCKGTSAIIPPEAIVYDAYELRTTFPEQIQSVEISFAVPTDWLAKNLTNSRYITLQQFANNKWSAVPVTRVAKTKQVEYYACTVQKTGAYAITATQDPAILHAQLTVRKARRSEYSKKTVAGLFILFLFLATVLSTYLLSAPAPFQLTTTGIPLQSWYVNTDHTINLGHYFKDPDNDTIKYTTRIGPHMSVEVQNNLALLTPETYWTGESYVIFAADDGKGGIVTSNAVKLVVAKPVLPVMILKYAKPALLGILIILVLLGVTFRKHVQKLFTKK